MAVKIWGKVAVRLSKHLFWRGVESIAPVTRRVGGLEIDAHECEHLGTVTRRVGGLEMINASMRLMMAVTRRVGGLENHSAG